MGTDCLFKLAILVRLWTRTCSSNLTTLNIHLIYIHIIYTSRNYFVRFCQNKLCGGLWNCLDGLEEIQGQMSAGISVIHITHEKVNLL